MPFRNAQEPSGQSSLRIWLRRLVLASAVAVGVASLATIALVIRDCRNGRLVLASATPGLTVTAFFASEHDGAVTPVWRGRLDRQQPLVVPIAFPHPSGDLWVAVGNGSTGPVRRSARAYAWPFGGGVYYYFIGDEEIVSSFSFGYLVGTETGGNIEFLSGLLLMTADILSCVGD